MITVGFIVLGLVFLMVGLPAFVGLTAGLADRVGNPLVRWMDWWYHFGKGRGK